MEAVDSIKLDSDEAGFELVIETDAATYRFNAHGVAMSGELAQQLRAVIADVDGWLDEGRRAAGEHQRDLDVAAIRDEEELARHHVDQLRKQDREGVA